MILLVSGKFNHSKSKVLVVGQRIDKNRKWYLGNGKIDETLVEFSSENLEK
jgi:hypothetical protein